MAAAKNNVVEKTKQALNPFHKNLSPCRTSGCRAKTYC
jgi:hypothetical protein